MAKLIRDKATCERYRDAAEFCEGLRDFVDSDADQYVLAAAAFIIRRETPVEGADGDD